MAGETLGPAFTDPPADNIVGIPTGNLTLSSPDVSYGLPFPEAAKKHVERLGRSKVYIICSGTLSRTTDALQRLIKGLGEDNVAGVRKGMTPHSLWSEILEVTADARKAQADCLITLGAGSLTDAAKIVTLVSFVGNPERQRRSDASLGPGEQRLYSGRAGKVFNREQRSSEGCQTTYCPPHLHSHIAVRRRVLLSRRRYG